MGTFRRVTATAVLTAGAVAVAMLPAGGASAGGQDQLAEVRQATKQFHDVQAAFDAGYRPTDHCVPGMGFHYVNPALVNDPAVKALAPEVLLYAPRPNGGVKLVGVEWLKFDADGNDKTVETINVVGQRMEGPMTHGLPLHYDLHAYIWQGNPDGVFSTFNRNISC
jgi:hypothetical protein